MHLPLAPHCTVSPFIYFSQFPSLSRSGEATRSSALYKGTMALTMICSSTFPPSPSTSDAVWRLQDPGALGNTRKPDICSEPCLPLTLLRARARKQPCRRVKHYQTEIQGLVIGSSRLAEMIIFHKINTARIEQQSLKILCSSVPPEAASLPPATVSLHPSPLRGPHFRAPGPKPEGNPSPARRIAYSPVIHLHGLRSRSRLWLRCNLCARVQSQHLHPGLDSTEPAARTRTPGQAAVPGREEGA